MFLQAKKLEGLSHNTLQNYFYFLRKLPSYTHKRVEDINLIDLRGFLSQECEGKKASTMNIKVTYLQNFFSWMVNEDIISKDPSRKLNHVKVPKRLRNSLTVEEIERLRISCIDKRERAILEIFFATGCRLDEIVKINIEDLNFIENSIRVIGKGNKERVVLFNAKTKVYINEYLKDRKGNSNALFTSIKQPYERLGRKGIRYVIKKIAKRANFDKSVFPHLFRHSMATIGLNNGASIVTIQQLLGHSSVVTTERYAQSDLDNVKHEYKQNLIL